MKIFRTFLLLNIFFISIVVIAMDQPMSLIVSPDGNPVDQLNGKEIAFLVKNIPPLQERVDVSTFSKEVVTKLIEQNDKIVQLQEQSAKAKTDGEQVARKIILDRLNSEIFNLQSTIDSELANAAENFFKRRIEEERVNLDEYRTPLFEPLYSKYKEMLHKEFWEKLDLGLHNLQLITNKNIHDEFQKFLPKLIDSLERKEFMGATIEVEKKINDFKYNLKQKVLQEAQQEELKKTWKKMGSSFLGGATVVGFIWLVTSFYKKN